MSFKPCALCPMDSYCLEGHCILHNDYAPLSSFDLGAHDAPGEMHLEAEPWHQTN